MKINFSDYIGVFVFLHPLLFYQLTAKNVEAGSETDERLNSLVILHVHLASTMKLILMAL